ncbi:MAG: RNA polymerase sigma factor [Acidimicrobiales bacterium]
MGVAYRNGAGLRLALRPPPSAGPTATSPSEIDLDLDRSGSELKRWPIRPLAAQAAGPDGRLPPPGAPAPPPPPAGASVTPLRARRPIEQGRSGPTTLDEATVDAAKRGDRDAWECAYLAYGKPLMGFLVLQLHDVDDASEALSETFLRGLEKVSAFRGDAASFRAWLYRIARNVATDRLRARHRLHPVAEVDERPDSAQPAADETMIASEDSAAARAALASLAPDDREVLWLRVCAGLSADEVGRIVGKRAGAVRMQQMRSLEAMARKMPPR